MENSKKPLKLALHGMGSRSTKAMMLFLQGLCKGIAHVVLNPEDADIDVFDGNAPGSKILLAKTKKPTTRIALPAVIQKISEKIEHPVDEPEKQELKTFVVGEHEPFDQAKHQVKKGLMKNH
jgi:hypothetical protein